MKKDNNHQIKTKNDKAKGVFPFFIFHLFSSISSLSSFSFSLLDFRFSPNFSSFSFYFFSFIFSLLSFSFTLLSFSLKAQTQTENYIKTTEYLTEQGESGAKKVSIMYFDGLGREKQAVQVKASPTGKDIIVQYEYDGFGRQVKDYLPVPTSQTNGGIITNPTSIYQNYYNTYYQSNIYYSEKEIENSPLNRVLKQAAPGNDWQLGSGHEIKFDYQTNTGGDEVIIFTVSSSGNLVKSKNGNRFYPNGELYKTETTDENGHTIEEYKNKQGQVVMKRSWSTTGSGTNLDRYDTYYVYDIYGNLTYVLPPKLLDLYYGGSGLPSNWRNKMNSLGYQYKYDDKNRLIEKKLPGKGWEYLVYDKQDRLVATQDAIQRVNKLWNFTKYDKFGRVVYTGIVTNGSSRAAIQNWLNTSFGSNNTSYHTTGFSHAGITIYYDRTAFPGSAGEVLTVNYYDNYNNILPSWIGIPEEIEGQDVRTGANNANESLKGLPTGNFTRIVGTNSWERTYTFYDEKARVINTYKINHSWGFSYTISQLDFRGKPNYTKSEHLKDNQSERVAIRNNFTYDAQERLIKTTQQINSDPEELIAKNEYDELGQLKNKKVGGDNTSIYLQKVDYKYNIRGWLTNINDFNNVRPTPGENPDLFSFQIQYNNFAFEEELPTSIEKLYNGNIAQTLWRAATDNQIRGYAYEYDELNRLKKANYHKPNATLPFPGNYDESLTYDKNGNIVSLQRNMGYDAPSSSVQVDNLTYQYNNEYGNSGSPNSNQLRKVIDYTNSSRGFSNGATGNGLDYTYDANGNMITDANKGITNIAYNHLNLPTQITWSSTKKIEYLYNAAGVKVQKTVTNGNSIKTTKYLDGFQYVDEKLEFFPTAEGYVKAIEITGGYYYNYIYNYTDHLGNIRLSYNQEPFTDQLKILEENHYYPFGLKHPKYSGGFNLAHLFNPYKYKYQGQERQDELGLNWDSFKWRNYDYAIGRFMSVDPLAEEYSYNGTYNFSENRVIDAIELEGLEAIILKEAKITAKANGDGRKSWFNRNIITPIANTFSSTTTSTAQGGMLESTQTNYYERNFDIASNIWNHSITRVGVGFDGKLRVANYLEDISK